MAGPSAPQDFRATPNPHVLTLPPLPRPAALLGALALFGLGSCASYPERTADAFNAFQGGQLERAVELYADVDHTGGEFLAGAEAGTVALAAGDWERAIQEFDRAAARVREHEDRALVSAEAAAEQLGGLLLNESQLPYVGEGYERVLLHASLALAYLAQGDVEGLWVETRRSNRLLESEEALYSKQYAAGGLGHFLSALAYELFNEPDNALIDYRRMLEKGVGVELAGRAALRNAARLGRLEDFPEWLERFGAPAELPEGAASVVLVAGLGRAPVKREMSITVPTPWGIARFAVPEFVTVDGDEVGLDLELADAGLSVASTEIENVRAVMVENLSDRIALLSVRSAARAAVKLTAREQLRKEAGIGGAILGDIFTLATERADLRSWTTLPAAFHGARAFVPPGVHRLAIRRGGATVDLGAFELEPGETLILLARGIGSRLHVHPIGGRPVPPVEGLPNPSPSGENSSGADAGAPTQNPD